MTGAVRLAAAVDNGGRHRVVVIGGGFGGLQAATHLPESRSR